MKEIFKVGDKVFDISAGWGTVYSVTDTDIVNYNVVVQFDMATYYYTSNGVNVEGYKKLSFTEYTFKGFSQERPIEEKMNLREEYRRESGFDVEVENGLGRDLIGSDYVEWLEKSFKAVLRIYNKSTQDSVDINKKVNNIIKKNNINNNR